MLRRIFTLILFTSCLLTGCIPKQIYQNKPLKTLSYQQVDFQTLVKRYLSKDKPNSIEGIYSVSGLVTKKGKGLLSNADKQKITDRKENYAKVAILRDSEKGGRDFIELSLDEEFRPSYSVVGEFTLASSGNILVYKHLDPKTKGTSYTFTTDEGSDMLEGIRVENEGHSTVTYQLTYVKVFPK